MGCLDALNRDYLIKTKSVNFDVSPLQRRQLWFLAKHYADCGLGDLCTMIISDYLRKCDEEGLFSQLSSDLED